MSKNLYSENKLKFPRKSGLTSLIIFLFLGNLFYLAIKEIELKIKQMQSGYKNYNFPIDIEFEDFSNKKSNYSVYIKGDTTLKYKLSNKLKNVVFDKNNWGP